MKYFYLILILIISNTGYAQVQKQLSAKRVIAVDSIRLGGTWRSTWGGTDISGKLNISDTASMLSPYIRAVGVGLLKTGQTVRADTTVLASKSYVANAVAGGSQNFANTNLTATGNRVHNWNGYAYAQDSVGTYDITQKMSDEFGRGRITIGTEGINIRHQGTTGAFSQLEAGGNFVGLYSSDGNGGLFNILEVSPSGTYIQTSSLTVTQGISYSASPNHKVLTQDTTTGRLYRTALPSTDTTSLSNRINLKLNTADSTTKYYPYVSNPKSYLSTLNLTVGSDNTDSLLIIDTARVVKKMRQGEILLAASGYINSKTVASTTLFTAPTGKYVVITKAVVVVSGASSITNGATVDLSKTAGGVVYPSTALTSLTQVAQTYTFSGGYSVLVGNGDVVSFNITTGASGVAGTYTVHLWGYYTLDF